MTKQYKVGTKAFFRGNEITIISKPYELYGGMWQDGVNSNGKTLTIPIPNQHKVNTKVAKSEFKEQQDGFARLKKLQR